MLFKVANVITGAGAGAKEDEGTSLTSVLETPALRVELALLVLLCTDAMRSNLVATFDPDKTHDTNSTTAAPQVTSNITTSTHDLVSFDEERDETAVAAENAKRARQRDVASTQTQALRRSALTFFDKWRAGVMHRICDVLCVRGDMVRQAKVMRKQLSDARDRNRKGISSLIDFEEDPFASDKSAQDEKRKHGHYEVIETKLLNFQEQKRVLILHCLLLLLLSLEQYTAYSRVLLLHLASSLKLETTLLAEHEKSVAQGLLASAASRMDAEETAKKQASNDAAARRWKVGLAAVGGAVLIGVTGGLAAPLLAAGLGTVMGGLGLGVVSTYLGALAGSSVLVGSLFGAYGANMTGKLMERYAKEVQDFEFVPIQGKFNNHPDRPSFQRDHEWADEQDARDPTKREQHRLRVMIGISGWLNSPSDVVKPWEVIDTSAAEPFALRFELDAMLRLGNSLNDVLFNYAWDGLTYTVVSRTILGALYAGLWPLGLLKIASVLDNPFSVALARADKAGKVLAHALIDGVQGARPVNLVGYSIGARVIHACLVELAEQHAFGLIESVVLMGTPAPSDSRMWRRIRSVVAGRVVNVYSTEDYVLGFLYRSTKLEYGVAGLYEVQDVYGIENANMSKLVAGHDKYRYLIGDILTRIGLSDLNFDKVAEQERALEVAERKKKQIKDQAKKNANDEQSRATTQPPKQLQSRSDILFDFDTEQQDVPPAPPAKFTQARSGQQPAIQRSIAKRSNARTTDRQLSFLHATDEDPLQDSHLTDMVSVPTAPFPTASAIRQHQIPTNLNRVPTTPLRRKETASRSSKDDADHHHIVMKDSVTEENKSSKDAGDSVHKIGPAVTIEEVMDPKDHHSNCSEVGSDTDDYDGDTDELGSEFGDLSMVEPIPMDDFDYGLM